MGQSGHRHRLTLASAIKDELSRPVCVIALISITDSDHFYMCYCGFAAVFDSGPMWLSHACWDGNACHAGKSYSELGTLA